MLTVIIPERTMLGSDMFVYKVFYKLDDSFKLFCDLDDSNIKLHQIHGMIFQNNFKAILENILFYNILKNDIREYSEYLRLKRKFEC